MSAKAQLAPGFLDFLSPHVALLIGGLKGSKEQREQVEEGLYHVTTTLKLTSILSVGADYPTKQVNKLEPWTLIALLIDKLPGTKIDDIVAEAAALMQTKKQDEVKGKADDAEERAQDALDRIKEQAADAIDVMKGATVQMSKGPVKVKELRVQVLSELVEQAHKDFPDEKRKVGA